MATCPINKKSKAWKTLVKAVGENNAYGLWNAYNGSVPKSVISQIEKKETTSVTQGTNKINVKKLQAILLQEVKTRQGYPLNMESAL